MTHIAFLTYQSFPDIREDDALALPYLQERGITVQAIPWDANIDWTQFDAIVIRSTWDYFLRPTEFLSFINDVEAAGVPLWNPPALVRWNADKRYLRELSEAGVRIVPTVWPEADAHLSQIRAEQNWQGTLVIKPCISGGAEGLWLSTLGGDSSPEADQARLTTMLAGEFGVMIQPLMPAIYEGEWSVLFFRHADGTIHYSHTVTKHPAEGEMRIQEQFGGIYRDAQPSEMLLEAAHRVLEAIPGDWLYARVDGVIQEDEFYLMELEVLEPSLFMGQTPDAPRNFAAALASRL